MPRCTTCHRRLAPGATCIEDGAIAPPLTRVESPPSPQQVGSLHVGALVGAGGFSSVYRAATPDDSPALAIKLGNDASASTLARFRREADALSVVGPPFVPRLVESGCVADGRPYLVMELVEGETLAEKLARSTSPPTMRESCELAIRILDALAAIRAHDLVHRDLKPENIILPPDGPARLIDFGLVRDIHAGPGNASLTRPGFVFGTSEYMAPEQLRGEPAGAAVDVYAFGVILYELLTGRPPFVGDRAAIEHGHLHMRPPCPSAFRSMSEPLEKLILSCLAKEPDRRPNDLASIRDELVRATKFGEGLSGDRARPTRTAITMDGTSPVVLVYIAGDVPAAELRELVEASRARIGRQRAGESVLALLAREQEHPLEAALGLAREATSRWQCRSVVHVGRALVRRSAGRVSLFGRDIERAAAWIPDTPWQGVLLTGRAAELLGVQHAGGFVPADALAREVRAPQLVGRDHDLRAVRSCLESALRDARPSCCVIVGEDGAGKTAVALALNRIAQGHTPELDTLLVSCRQLVPGDAGQTLRHVLQFLLGVDADSAPDAPVALIAQHMGEQVARTCSEGVLEALGWSEGCLAPGVFRDQVRRAVLAGLQARAAHKPLVIIVDDAHFADDLTLEILDRARELDGSALTLVLTCAPRFAQSNRAWSVRSESLTVIELRPLDESTTATLAKHLLPPGTRVSAEVLHRLARWSGGNAGVLTQLINILRRERIVRQHEGTSSWFVAADELDRLPASPAGEWLATRELDSLAPELADCARICAILGVEISLHELEAVQRALETDGYDRPLVDAAAGLSMLVHHGLLVEIATGRFSFRRRSVQEALYALVPEEARRTVHRASFEHWRAHADAARHADAAGIDTLFRLAHHGARGGYAGEARLYYAALAARAKARHAHHEAERMLTAAIDLCTPDQIDVLYDHLEERGNVRRLLTHYEGARRDFQQARELAERMGDRVKMVSVLVAEAAVCDFTQEWDAQARLMQTAQALARDGLPARVEARYRNWLGVTRARQGSNDEAIQLLGDAVALGGAIGDHETEVGSGLLLGYLLVVRGDRDAGLAILQETMARCERVGDWFHFVMGLNNRIILSKLTDDPQGQAEVDCQRAIEISHENGFHQLEIWGLLNLSLTRWWRGNLAGALHAARQAYLLSVERFGSKSSHRERLHYAMQLVAHGRGAEVEALLHGVREQELQSSPIDCANLRAIRLALRGGTEREWREVIEHTRDVGDDWDFVEVLWLRARAALHAGDRAAARDALREAYEQAVHHRAPLAETLLSEQRAIAA